MHRAEKLLATLLIVIVLATSCTLTYKSHNTGQKYKAFEIRWLQKRDTTPLDTVRLKPIKIEH
jgi:hypothetical protein